MFHHITKEYNAVTPRKSQIVITTGYRRNKDKSCPLEYKSRL